MIMTKLELWVRLTTKNPHWLCDGVNLTPKGLEKLFDVVYQNAYNEGRKQGINESTCKSDPASGKFDDLFSDDLFSTIFGGTFGAKK